MIRIRRAGSAGVVANRRLLGRGQKGPMQNAPYTQLSSNKDVFVITFRSEDLVTYQQILYSSALSLWDTVSSLADIDVWYVMCRQVRD